MKINVFSTYVEVIPFLRVPLFGVIGILHVCGGDPNMQVPKDDSGKYSPRMWR